MTPLTEDELKRRYPVEESHYNFLKSHPQEQWPVKYFYDRLNIIDSKTGALLRVNSTIIAFLGAIVVLLAHSNDIKPPLVKDVVLGWIIVILVVLAVSDLVSLSAIFWLRFDRINDPDDFVRYRWRFYQVTARREVLLRFVICLSFTGELLFVVLFIYLAYIEMMNC